MNEIAVNDITADWKTSEATKISQVDKEELQRTAPEFGVLREDGGWKLYAFLPGGIIKKKVIHKRNGVLQDMDGTLPKIRENGITLKPLHRDYLTVWNDPIPKMAQDKKRWFVQCFFLNYIILIRLEIYQIFHSQVLENLRLNISYKVLSFRLLESLLVYGKVGILCIIIEK